MNMRKRYFRAVLTVLVAGTVANVFGANIVTNPNFETGDLSGWNVSGVHSSPADNGIYYGVDGMAAHTSAFGGYFGPVGGVLNLNQILTTAPGTSYNITFWLAQSPDTVPGYLNSFSVAFGGNTLYSQTDVPNSAFTQYSFSSTAASANSLLSFGFRDDLGFFSLDDISVTPVATAVPEPATWLLFLVASGFYLIARKLRAQTVQHVSPLQ